MKKCHIKRLRLFITAFVKIILVFIGKYSLSLGIYLVCARNRCFFGILIFFITDYEKVIKNILHAICKVLLVELY